jgi:hypothetical protein
MGIGFWKGKIELKVPTYTYAPGETIKGEVTLELKKPTKARKITIRLVGAELTTRREFSGGSYRTHHHRVNICDILIPLDGEKEYKEGKYDFEITVPPDALHDRNIRNGALGGVVEAVEIVTGTDRHREWYLEANLDIPMGFDVSKKQDIVIR